MYAPVPDYDTLAFFGIQEHELDKTEIWSCNLDSYTVFASMATQWRTGFNGATGLDYNCLPVVMNLCSISQEKQPSVFSDIRLMERAALEEMVKQRD